MLRHWLAARGDALRTTPVKRFAPRLWTVDFPRPMMAAVTTPGVGTLRCDLSFLRRNDLAGLVWASEDRWSHPLLSYATDRDYSGCTLAFDWSAGPGCMPLDAVNGPTLTVEGRDEQGAPATWYVRLWNYADGSPMRARIVLPFDDLRAGFGGDGPRVWPHAIDRMSISLVADGFDGVDAPLPTRVDTWLELSNPSCDGEGSVLAMGDAFLPEQPLRMCSAYDDSYHQAPERLVEQWFALGHRGWINHYVGMSHYPALAFDAASGRYLPDAAVPVCPAAETWHAALARACVAAGFRLIVSLSYELFADHAPEKWVQRAHDGTPGLTGWVPPSALLSPCNADAMAWLQSVAARLMAVVVAEGTAPHFQVGEPWWWVGPEAKPCFYDAATVAAWTAEHGGPPPVITDMRGAKTAEERAFLAWLGVRLAESTLALADAARAGAGGACTRYLLFYAPQVLDAAAPDLRLANMPAGWAFPAWDVLQLEDYTSVTAGDEAGMARGVAAVTDALGYPTHAQHYLAGFVLNPADARQQWPRIADAADAALARGVAEVFAWAWPQVARDGFACTLSEERIMPAFHDVSFPLDPGFAAVGGPEFSTQVALMASGHEQRNSHWASARLRYDAGLGVRSERDLAALVAFFRARRGQAHGFRFRDPLDQSSAADGQDAPAMTDQRIGTGDGLRLRFPLVKTYGEGDDAEVRRITRPVAGSVTVAVDGAPVPFALEPLGVVRLDVPAAVGAVVTAGFLFDVPVRFAEDRLEVSLSSFRAGELPSVPLVEVREDA